MLCDFVTSFSWNEAPHQFLLLSTPFLSTPLLDSHHTSAPITTRLPLRHAPTGLLAAAWRCRSVHFFMDGSPPWESLPSTGTTPCRWYPRAGGPRPGRWACSGPSRPWAWCRPAGAPRTSGKRGAASLDGRGTWARCSGTGSGGRPGGSDSGGDGRVAGPGTGRPP